MAQGRTTGAANISIDPVIGQLISAAGAVLGGWRAIEPRYARLRMFRREGGQYGSGFFVLYRVPQALNVMLLLALIIGVVLALFGGLEAQGFLPKFTQQSYVDFARFAKSVYGLGWVFVFAAILIGLLIYFDVFAMVAITTAWALSFLLPLPTLRVRFGPYGGSLGWHQARELLRNQGQAQLFWIDEKGVERVTAAVFDKLAREPLDGRDRAPTPETASLDERANIALFGCIIEQIETDLQKPQRQWNIFYAALAEAAATTKLFEPETLRNESQSFAERVRNDVNPLLAGS